MAELKDIINTLDKAADAFDHIATAEQDKLYEDILLLAKQLDTDTQGKVKQSIANLKRLTQIRAKLASLAKDKDWTAGIAEFSKYFGLLQKQQNAYFSQHFPEHTLTETAKQKHNLMKQMAVQNTVEALMGDGLKANVTDKLNDILLRAVTGGAKFKDLQEELRAHLLGTDGGQGALARYANTYAVTALSQFTGQNNKLLTDDLDTEWFMYTGSNIETTREFCQHLTEKKYIHKSEIPEIIKGKINDYQCEIYAKTGLPYGMIAGTTPENFQINCGGWNCRHQLVPVAKETVPKDLRAKFETLSQEELQRQKEAQEKAEQIENFKKFVESHKGLRDIDINAVDSAIRSGDVTAIANITTHINNTIDGLNELSPIIPNIMMYAQQFTLAELKSVAHAVQNTMQTWVTKHGYGTIDNADPLHLKAKCEQEIGALKSNKKYATWGVAVKAYEQHIKKAERQLTQNAIACDIATLKAYKTKSPQYKQYISEAEQAFAVGNITKAKSLIASAQAKQIELEKRHSTQAKGTPKIDIGNKVEQKGHVTDTGTREEIIEKLTGVSDKPIIERYLKAVDGFSYEWDWEIRQIHCGNTSFKSKYNHSMAEIQQRAADVEEYITKAPKWAGGTTYRGMSLSPKEVEQLRKDLQAGQGNMQGAASWSTRESCSQNFAGFHIGETSPLYGDKKSMRVVLVASRHRKATSIKYLSSFSGEDEVLSSKDCRWRIVREYTKGGYTYFDVEPSN